jgi:hypothetical protein
MTGFWLLIDLKHVMFYRILDDRPRVVKNRAAVYYTLM